MSNMLRTMARTIKRDIAKEIRSITRECVGQPKASQVIKAKRGRKVKHKKREQTNEN